MISAGTWGTSRGLLSRQGQVLPLSCGVEVPPAALGQGASFRSHRAAPRWPSLQVSGTYLAPRGWAAAPPVFPPSGTQAEGAAAVGGVGCAAPWQRA